MPASARSTAASIGWRFRPQRPDAAVVTRLERRYAAFDGLNLTWETLEGLAKHNGPLLDAPAGRSALRAAARRCPEISDYSGRQDLRSPASPSAEAQVGAIADDIAYDAHDIDDGLRAGCSVSRISRGAAAAATSSARSRRLSASSTPGG